METVEEEEQLLCCSRNPGSSTGIGFPKVPVARVLPLETQCLQVEVVASCEHLQFLSPFPQSPSVATFCQQQAPPSSAPRQWRRCAPRHDTQPGPVNEVRLGSR